MASKKQKQKRFYDKNGLIRWGRKDERIFYPKYKKVKIDFRHNLEHKEIEEGHLWYCTTCDYKVIIPNKKI